MPGPIVIGGGPAGASAAIALACAGRPVTLIERNGEACDKVCGDFLSAEAIAMAEAVGVDLSAAAPIESVRLIYGNRVAASRLPFRALGLSRRAFDEALLRRAQASGVSVLRGHRVSAIEPAGPSLSLTSGSLGRQVSDAVFLATGKHELRGVARPCRGTGLVGMKMYYELAPRQREALRNNIELVLFPGGYGGLQLVEHDRAVVCALVPGGWLRAEGEGWSRLIDASPHLCARLSGAVPVLPKPLAISGLPYGYVHAADGHESPGLFRLGDQAVVIGSLTGDGVALALASGSLAARVYLSGQTATKYHRQLAVSVSRQMRLASATHRLCLDPTYQPWLSAACGLWPGSLRLIASLTRARHLVNICNPSLTHGRHAA